MKSILVANIFTFFVGIYALAAGHRPLGKWLGALLVLGSFLSVAVKYPQYRALQREAAHRRSRASAREA